MSERLAPWGHSGTQPPATRDTIQPRDLPPLPGGSILDPFDDASRSRNPGALVTVLLSLWFLVPMICVGVMLKFQ